MTDSDSKGSADSESYGKKGETSVSGQRGAENLQSVPGFGHNLPGGYGRCESLGQLAGHFRSRLHRCR